MWVYIYPGSKFTHVLCGETLEILLPYHMGIVTLDLVTFNQNYTGKDPGNLPALLSWDLSGDWCF